MALRLIILTSLLFLYGGPLVGCLPKGTKAAKVAKTPAPTPTPRPVETISSSAPVQGGFLTGELMKNDGTPLADAEVSVVLRAPSSLSGTGNLLWLTSFFLDDQASEFATTTDETGHFAIPIEKIASARVRLRINAGERKLVSDISLPPDLAAGINQARMFAGLAPLADVPETQASGTGATNTSTLGSLTERKLALQLPVNRTSGPADAATTEIEEETLSLLVSSLPVPTETDGKSFGLWAGIENVSNDDVVGFVWQNPFSVEGKTRIVFTKAEADLSYWNGEEKSAPKYSGIISGANIITAYTGCNDPSFRTSASGPLTSKSDSRCGLKKSQFPFNAGNDVYIRAATEFDGSIRLSPVWKIAAKNKAPILNPIEPQSINLGSTSLQLPLELSDLDSTLSCHLALSVQSTNSEILPAQNIVIVGDKTPNCSLHLYPVPEQLGTTTLAVVAKDEGSLTASQSFSFWVRNPNLPPSLNPVDATQTLEDTLATVPVTIVDSDGPKQTCSSEFLSYTSSNTAVVAATGAIIWGGEWPNCTATVATVLHSNTTDQGNVEISLTVSDGSLTSDAQTFALTVTPVNDAPVVSAISAQTIDEDTQTTTITMNIEEFDINSPNRNCDDTYLSYTAENTNVVAATNAVAWGGTWPFCTAIFTPLQNASGTTVLTISASDGDKTGEGQSFTLTVNPVNDAPSVEAIAPQTTLEDVASPAIALKVLDDGNTPKECNSTYLFYTSATPAVVANTGAVAWGGTWPDCTAVFMPQLNATGEAILSVAASDDGTTVGNATVFTLNVASINDAPTILEIADATIVEDLPTIDFSITVTDTDSMSVLRNCDSSSLEYTSGSTSVVTATNAVTWSGIWPNCTAQLTPLANAHGTSLITFRAFDGEKWSAGESFTLTVTPINDPPTVSAMTGVTTNEDSATSAIPVNINDVDINSPNRTCDGSTLFYVSGNEDVVAASGAVEWGGTWPNCSAVITPRTNASGTVVLSISASDGIATGSGQSLNLTVTSVNDAPSIAGISAQTTNEDTSTNQIVVAVTDVDGPPRSCDNESLSYSSSNTLVVAASDSVTWTGTWPNCTAIFTPIRDGVGTTTLTLRATDGSDQGAPQSFTLNVISAPQWLETHHFRRNDLNAHFGAALALSADTVAIGAFGDPVNQSTITNAATADTATNGASPNSGAVFVYRKSGNNWVQEAYVKASNSDANDQLGRSVSLSGDTMSVGADFEDSNETTITTGAVNTNNDDALSSGAVYVFGRTGTTWSSEAYIKATNAEANDYFGTSVALQGNLLAVGAIGEDSSETQITNLPPASSDNSAELSGAVFVYRKSSGQWNQEAYIKAANASSSSQFGYSVALSSDTLAVGAHQEDSGHNTITNGPVPPSTSLQGNSGAVYLYRKTTTGWAQEAYIKAVNVGANDEFGSSVALSGELLAVGAPREDSQQTSISNNLTADSSNTKSDSGALYLYRRSGTQWEQEAFIKAANSDATDQFGSSVALSGSTLAVGAPNEASEQATLTNGSTASDNNATPARGAVYVYRRLGSSWSQEAYVKASSSNCGEKFGTSVSLSGDTLAGGADGCAGSTGGFFALFKNTSRMYDPDVRITGKTQTSISFAWGNNLGGASTVRVALAVLGSASAQTSCEGGTTLTSDATPYSYSGLTAGTQFGFRFCTTDGSNASPGTTLWEATLP
jgi:hypothetical protein